MRNKVSIVVPCRNEEKYIGQCLDSLIYNDYKPVEIIVIDGDSDDDTKKILENYQERHNSVQVLENKEKYTPISLNKGIRNASGDYIMIAGAHSFFPPDYISGLVEVLEGLPEAVGVGGTMEIVSDDSYKANVVKKVLSDKFGVGNSTFRVGTRNLADVDTLPFGLYYEEVFQKAGLYDERLIRNQDIEWSKRAVKYAGQLFLVPGINCTYYLRGSYAYLAWSNFRNGFWNILTIYLTKNPSSLRLRHFIPLVFMLSLILPIFGAIFFSSVSLWLPLMVLGLYLVTMGRRSIFLAERHKQIPGILCAFLTLHLSYGLGSLIGLFQIHRLFSIKRSNTAD
ncbi:MAG: glycosyltransferase family 2 protein [Bacteroidales bacterium]